MNCIYSSYLSYSCCFSLLITFWRQLYLIILSIICNIFMERSMWCNDAFTAMTSYLQWVWLKSHLRPVKFFTYNSFFLIANQILTWTSVGVSHSWRLKLLHTQPKTTCSLHIKIYLPKSFTKSLCLCTYINYFCIIGMLHIKRLSMLEILLNFKRN